MTVFTEKLYPWGGGAEYATWLFIKGLVKRGIKVVVFTCSYQDVPSKEHVEGAIIYNLRLTTGGKSKYATLPLTLKSIVSKTIEKEVRYSDAVYIPRYWYIIIPYIRLYIKKPVIVHIHDYIPICPLAYLSYMSSKICSNFQISKCSKCVVYHEREQRRNIMEVLTSSILNVFGAWQIIRYCLKYASKIIFTSDYQKEIICKHYNEIIRRDVDISVIPNPISEDLMDKNLVIDTYRPFAFLYSGGENRAKGFYELFKAIRKSQRSFHLYLLNMSKNKTIYYRNKVLYFMRKIPHKKYISMLSRNVSAVIVPSLCPEAFPYSVIEAMVLGKVVVASRNGSIPSILGRGKGVFYIDPADTSEFSDVLDWVSGLSKDEIVDMGLKNRELILKKYDFESVIDNFIKVLESVVK